MHVLVLYAHPEPTSFTAALKDTAVRALTNAGHTVTVSDLYGEEFDTVGGRGDFTKVADPARFHYQSEQEHAHAEDGFCDEVAREQARFAAADLVVPVFPVWWGGMPAILKGWFDRVLAYGFAYIDGHRLTPASSAAVAARSGSSPAAPHAGSPPRAPAAPSSRSSGRQPAA